MASVECMSSSFLPGRVMLQFKGKVPRDVTALKIKADECEGTQPSLQRGFCSSKSISHKGRGEERLLSKTKKKAVTSLPLEA